MNRQDPEIGSDRLGKIEDEEDFLFGVGHPTNVNHSQDYLCPQPECAENAERVDIERVMNSVVGVRLAPFGSTGYSHDPDKKYALMCECPHCYGVYWFHGDRKMVEVVREIKRRRADLRSMGLGDK